jgi:hypothetical protein
VLEGAKSMLRLQLLPAATTSLRLSFLAARRERSRRRANEENYG